MGDAEVISIREEAENFKNMAHFRTAMRFYIAEYVREKPHSILNRAKGINNVGTLATFMLSADASRSPGSPRSGITLANVQRFASDHEVCSPKYVPAFIYLLRFGGFLEETANNLDRRVKCYQFTEKAYRTARVLTAIPLRAISMMTEDHRFIDRLEGTDGNRFLSAMAAASLRAPHDLADIRSLLPEIEFFHRRMGGYEAALKIISLYLEANVPNKYLIDFNYARVSKELNVNRIQIVRLINIFEAEGYITTHRRGGNVLEISPHMLQIFENLVGTIFALSSRLCWAADEHFSSAP